MRISKNRKWVSQWVGKWVVGLLLTLTGLLAHPLTAPAQSRYTLTITVTNLAVSGDTITVNGVVRTWAATESATLIQTNLLGAGPTKTNLFRQISRWNYAGPLILVDSSTNVLKLVTAFGASAISASASGTWATMSIATQSGPSTYSAVYPMENLSSTDRVNQASSLVSGLSAYSTNAFATNAVAISNVLSKGASPLQRVLGQVLFNSIGGTNRGLTNGNYSAPTLINPISTNLVNYANAIRSEGPGVNSLQVGSNAWALSLRSVAIGNGALATNSDTVAIGTGATATNTSSIAIGSAAATQGATAVALGTGAVATNGAVAIGSSAQALGDTSIALGPGATASAPSAIDIGDETSSATGYGAIGIGFYANATAIGALAIGLNATAGHSNSAAIGPVDFQGNAVTTTETNQIRLGTINQSVSIPGTLLISGTQSNTTFTGTNLWKGDLSLPWRAITTLANGNNISLSFGTNVLIRLSGTLTSTGAICGVIAGATTGGRDGQLVLVWNDTGQNVELKQNTVDPVPANRWSLYGGQDVTMLPDSFVWATYAATVSRWKIAGQYPANTNVTSTATVTNAISTIWSNGVVVTSTATNLDFFNSATVTFFATNVSGHVGVTATAAGGGGGSGSGETNFVADAAVTNATMFGLSWGKTGTTNYVRTIAARNGLVGTNEGGTNISLAINPAIVASQVDLTASSNSLRTTTIDGLSNKVDKLNGVATNLTLYTGSPGLTVRPLPGIATNSLQITDTNGVPVLMVLSNGVFQSANPVMASGYRSSSAQPSRGLILGDSTSAYLFAAGFAGVDTFLLTAGDIKMGTVVSNIAKGGDHIEWQRTNLVAAASTITNYDWFCISVGINDLNWNVPYQNMTSNLQALVNEVNSRKKTNAIIVLATMTPLRGYLEWAYDSTNGGDPAAAFAQWTNINWAIMGGGTYAITNVQFRVDKHTRAMDNGWGYIVRPYNLCNRDFTTVYGDCLHENDQGRMIIASAYREALNLAGYLENTPPVNFDGAWMFDGTNNSYLRGSNGVVTGSLLVGSISGSVNAVTPTNTLDVSGNASIRTNLFLPNLPTNASPIAFLTVDGGGKVYETAAPSGGSGEANVNGEISNTNATKIGLVYGKAGVTNQLRSLQAGAGVVLTNEGTNVVIASAGLNSINENTTADQYITLITNLYPNTPQPYLESTNSGLVIHMPWAGPAVSGALNSNQYNAFITADANLQGATNSHVARLNTLEGSTVMADLSNRMAVADFVRFNMANVPMTWFSNSWVNYGAGAIDLFARKEGAKVYVRGTIKHPTGTTANGDIFGRVPTLLEPPLAGAEYLQTGYYDGAYKAGSFSVAPNSQMAAFMGNLTASGLAILNGTYYCEDFFESATNSLNATNRTLVMFPVPFPSKHKVVHSIGGYTADEYSTGYRWIEGRDSFRSLLTNGWTVLCSAGEPSNWGNRWGINVASNSLYWFTNTFQTTNIVIYSGSMGGLASLSWMAQNTRIQRWYGVYPCMNLGHIYTNNATFAGYIETAYGFSGAANYAAATAGFDPYRDITTNTMAGRRFRMTASPSDTAVSETGNANTWSAKHTNTATVRIVQATGEHGDASHFSPTNVLSFFNEP